MRRKRVRRPSERGFTLVEVLAAVALIAFGSLATYQLIALVVAGNRHVRSQVDTMAMVSRLVAETQDARFMGPAERDPHLFPGVYDATSVRDPESRIQSFGWLQPDGAPGESAGSATYQIRYEVTACGGCGDLGGAEILIVMENASAGGPLRKPVEFVLRREHLRSLAQGRDVRGW